MATDAYRSAHASPAASLRARAAQHPDRIALRTEHRTLTYGELDQRADRVAAALAAHGITRGDRIAYVARNRPEYLELQLGAGRLGAVPVPINWRLAPREVDEVLADAAPALTFVSDDERRLLGPRSAGLSTIDLDGAGYERFLATATGPPPGEPPAPDDAMWQLYTSGTTGQPKGVVLTNANLMHMIEGLCDAWGFREDSVVYIPYPVFHAVGSAWPVLTLHRGGQVILRDGFDTADLRDAARVHGVTNTMMVPAVLQLVLDAVGDDATDLASLRTVVYGAAPMTDALLHRAVAALPGCAFIHAYGLTEATGTVATLPWEEHDPTGPRARSCGRALGWVELRVVDPDNLVDRPVGEVGEVIVRSRSVMAGYYRRPEDTAAAITPDGWLRTGDAGSLDADGYLTLTDRVKDMIISGGENIYPAEVENVLHDHPEVREVAVVGIPDARWGEAVHAVVVVDPQAAVGEAELIAWCRERLATYKCPRSVDLRTESLPLNPTGKVLRRALRDPYWQGHDRRI